jgi:hypothetical protein
MDRTTEEAKEVTPTDNFGGCVSFTASLREAMSFAARFVDLVVMVGC